jgi:hypothetical protein
MSLRILVWGLSLMVMASSGCIRKTTIKGDEMIPREVLVDVLVDIHLIDGVTNDRKFFRRYEEADSIDILGPIFEKYQVTSEMFDATMLEYSRYPDQLDQVYNDVLTKLNVMLDENENIDEKVDGNISVQ